MLDTQGVPFGSLKAFIYMYKYGKCELLKKIYQSLIISNQASFGQF